MLLAKTSDSGLVYGLSLVSDGGNFLLRLAYQQSANGQSLGMATAEVSLPQSDLADGAWHSLIVAVGQGIALFYRDSSLLTSRWVPMDTAIVVMWVQMLSLQELAVIRVGR